MDSLSQIALGAAVSVAVMGRRTPVGRAALWGAVCGTLPDLDVFVDYGNAVHNMVLHRGETHAPFYLLLAAPLFAAGIARIHGEWDRFRWWWLAITLALVTHPLLDVMTIYGTQLGLPFTNHPYGVGSIFIIDPLYTVPLLVGVIAALSRRDERGVSQGLGWNQVGLAVSTLYLAWGVVAQQHVRGIAEAQLQASGAPVERLLVSPTAFNSVLWRIVAVAPDHYLEGYRSLLDGDAPIVFDRFERRPELYEPLKDHDPVRRVAAFSHGFFEMNDVNGDVTIADLRMGQAPFYFFTFVVGRQEPDGIKPLPPEPVGVRPPTGETWQWLQRRMTDPTVAPPRG